MLAALAKELLTAVAQRHASGDTKEYEVPWFKDCIGSKDVTRILTVILTDKVISCRSRRKNECTQNVMVVYSFACVSRGYGPTGRFCP